MVRTLKDLGGKVTPIFHSSVLPANATLAALAMQVISTWAVIDAFLMQILTICAKAEFALVSGMLSALNSSQAQRDAAIAGFEASLNREDFRLLKAVLATTTESQKLRNHFAHHMWGGSPELPNHLMLLNPRDVGGALTELLRATTSGKDAKLKHDHSKIRVFDEPSLTNEVKNALRTLDLIHKFGFIALGPPGDRQGDAKRDELRRDPEISRLLQSQSKQKPPPTKPK